MATMTAVKNFVKMVVAMFVILVSSVAIVSCDQTDDVINYSMKPVKDGGTTTDVTTTITREGDYGKIVAERTVNGVKQDTTVTVYLGKVEFNVSANDTVVVANNSVSHNSFNLASASVDNYETDGVFYTKSTRNFTDTYDKYTKTGSISYLDAYTYVWGKRCDFPKANGNVIWKNVATSDAGTKKAYNYTLCTSTYEVSFMGSKQSEELGYYTLATNAEDKLISTVKTNEGFEVLTYDENGNPATEKSWIEVTRTYSVSGAVVSKYEVILNSSVVAPAYDIKVLSSFNLNQVGANLSEETHAGSRVEGNFTINQHVQTYTVGNDKFTKSFVLTHETATWADSKNSFEMPKACFEGINDRGYTMSAMSSTEEYNRQLNVHSIAATFANKPVAAKAETEIRVMVTKDELISSTITGEGFDYVNENTSNAWIEITEIWSVSGKKTYKKSVNLYNNITAPAAIVKIVDNFTLNQVSAALGEETLVNTRTVGEFTVKTFNREYSVGNDKFTRVFVLSYEKAYHNPTKHDMLYKEYEAVSDNGFNTAAMSDKVSEGVNYNRMGYNHTMSASFNGHGAQAVASAELWKKAKEERETPTWLGAPVSAKYTRVQKATGDKFMDMIVFTYENGVVMAPNGKVDMNLIYAFDAATASKQGVERCARKASYSGVWTGSKWAPAKIIVSSGRWIYAGVNAAWDHTVMENNAIILGIGKDVTPTPKAQSYKIEGNKITISYAVNNGKTTADTSLSLR